MTHLELVPVPPVAQLAGVSQHYGKTVALNNITLDIPARCMVGLIGPDGVGKSSLLSLISGARVIEQGNVMVLGGDVNRARRVAQQIVSGRVLVNTLAHEPKAPFGGFKHSGVGREMGEWGIRAFMEPRSVLG